MDIYNLDTGTHRKVAVTYSAPNPVVGRATGMRTLTITDTGNPDTFYNLTTNLTRDTTIQLIRHLLATLTDDEPTP